MARSRSRAAMRVGGAPRAPRCRWYAPRPRAWDTVCANVHTGVAGGRLSCSRGAAWLRALGGAPQAAATPPPAHPHATSHTPHHAHHPRAGTIDPKELKAAMQSLGFEAKNATI